MRVIALFFLSTVAVFPASGEARDAADPLNTEALLATRPRAAGSGCLSSLPDTRLSAAEAVDLALCNHPQTRELWAAARAQAAQVGIARGAWLPGLGGAASTTRYQYESNPYTRNTASITLSWLLLDAGLRAANAENALQLLQAALATQDATLQSLMLATLQAYYSAQATQAAVLSSSQAERSAAEALRAARARYDAGVATPADRLQAQTALSQAQLARIRAEGEARNALGTLAYALGFTAPQHIVLAELPTLPGDTRFQEDVDGMIEEAMRRRPDLRAAEAQARAYTASVDAARAQGLPSLSLNAGPLWQENRQDSGSSIVRGNSLGVTLNVPIFSGFDTSYRVRAAEAQAALRLAQRDRLRNQVALDVWKAYHSLATATQSLQATADLVASAEQSERVALGRYKAGVGTVLDLLAAQSALASARLQRIQAQLEWNIYRASLAQSMGVLDGALPVSPAEGNQ